MAKQLANITITETDILSPAAEVDTRDHTLVNAIVAPGRSVYKSRGKVYGPGEAAPIESYELERLRAAGYVV